MPCSFTVTADYFMISSWGQFHQHFTRTFFVWKQIAQLVSNYSLALWLFVKRILAKKARVKCLWNWPLVIFRLSEWGNIKSFQPLYFSSSPFYLRNKKSGKKKPQPFHACLPHYYFFPPYLHSLHSLSLSF